MGAVPPPADEVPVRSDAELLEELGRHLRAADVLLAGLAADMAAAGAQTASERTQRARAQLEAAERIARALHERWDGDAGR